MRHSPPRRPAPEPAAATSPPPAPQERESLAAVLAGMALSALARLAVDAASRQGRAWLEQYFAESQRAAGETREPSSTAKSEEHEP